jgi:hypothetical protein
MPRACLAPRMHVMQVWLGGGGRVLESDPNNEPGCLSLDTVAWQPGSVYDVTVSACPRGHNTELTVLRHRDHLVRACEEGKLQLC